MGMIIRIENHTGRKLALAWKEAKGGLTGRGGHNTAVSEVWSGENALELSIWPPAAEGGHLLIVVAELTHGSNE
jgi:hypothetical protein